MQFDINILRSAATVVSLITFIGIVIWAWSARNQADFERSAHIPFDQD